MNNSHGIIERFVNKFKTICKLKQIMKNKNVGLKKMTMSQLINFYKSAQKIVTMRSLLKVMK